MIPEYLVGILDQDSCPKLLAGTEHLADATFPFYPPSYLLVGFLPSPERSHLFHVIWTTSFSMSSASPFSSGSAIIVILFLRRETVVISLRDDGNGSNWQDLGDCALPGTQRGRGSHSCPSLLPSCMQRQPGRLTTALGILFGSRLLRDSAVLSLLPGVQRPPGLHEGAHGPAICSYQSQRLLCPAHLGEPHQCEEPAPGAAHSMCPTVQSLT